MLQSVDPPVCDEVKWKELDDPKQNTYEPLSKLRRPPARNHRLPDGVSGRTGVLYKCHKSYNMCYNYVCTTCPLLISCLKELLGAPRRCARWLQIVVTGQRVSACLAAYVSLRLSLHMFHVFETPLHVHLYGGPDLI